ncbi:MAG: hypothetical protein NT004_13120 [Bacteroidetes bacterium]|nr:hypothetical protein [Bacteroidota bacterium]
MDKHIAKLNKMIQQDMFDRHPNDPKGFWENVGKITVNSANSLTKAVIKFIRLKGYHADNIKVTRRMIDNRVTYTDVLGHVRQIGSCKWIKSSMKIGSADISATLQGGKSVMIEVKWGKDRQSEAQKRFQASIEKAGGVYLIIHKFEEFYEWYMANYPDSIK